MSEGITSLGAGDLDRSFFGRSGSELYNQQGLRDYISSPEQGQLFNTISREASRNLFNSITRPSDWKSVLGQQPAAQSNYRLDSGEYTAPGSVRSRTGLGGAELRAPGSIYNDYRTGVFGNGRFGGNEDSFEFSYGDTDYEPVARVGSLGSLVSDRSGVSMSQAPFSLEEPYSFSSADETKFGDYGQGSFRDEGRIQASLRAPQSGLTFDNSIKKRLAGSGRADLTTNMSGNATSQSSEQVYGNDRDSANELGQGSLGMLGSLAGGPASWIVKGLSMIPELVAPSGGYTTRFESMVNPRAEAGIQTSTNLGLEGPGSFDYNRDSEANSYTEMLGLKGSALSDVSLAGSQTAKGRAGSRGQINLSMDQDYGGVSNTQLTEQDVYDTVAGPLGGAKTNNIQYTAQSQAAQSQDATQNTLLEAVNKGLITDKGVPTDWISQNVNQDLIDNFDTYKSRYPGLYGQYGTAQDYITRKYYQENPQTTLSAEQVANILTSSEVDTPETWWGADYVNQGPDADLDFQNKQNVITRSNIGLSGEAAANVLNNVDVTTNQTTNTQQDDFANSMADWQSSLVSPEVSINPSASSNIDLNINSEQEIILQGLGAEAGVVNDLKYKFNNEEYGATLKLQAQRMINGLEEQLPMTRDTQLFINSLRNNPELTALFEQNIAPETIIKAALDYDNVNKKFTNTLDWETNTNYQAPTVYDPTPDQPNSGDEIALANMFGDVRILDPGKLYDIGVRDEFTYTPEYKLTAPMTNVSNEYFTDTGNPYTQVLDNNMYYYNPGQNDLYNRAAEEFINRRYDLQDYGQDYISVLDELNAYDFGNLDSAISSDLLQGGYTAEDFTNLQNLLQQEYAVDTGNAYTAPTTGQVSRELYIPETQNINTNFGVFNIDPFYGFNRGKGLPIGRLDPRATNPEDAALLDKYFDFNGRAAGDWFAAYPNDYFGPNVNYMTEKTEMTGPRKLTEQELGDVAAQRIYGDDYQSFWNDVQKYQFSDRTDYGAFNPYKGYSYGYTPAYLSAWNPDNLYKYYSGIASFNNQAYL